VFIDDSCIGCGNCQRNCPYGVIRMDKVPPKKPGLLSWLFFGSGRAGRAVQEVGL
jgi:Fe-S-cluster-containing dehydrogenase component